jgi:hypothetical protein
MKRELIVGTLVVAGALAWGHRHVRGAEAPPRGLPPPEHVVPEAQDELKARMARHANTMQELVRAVVVLDRPTIRVLATRIADEDLIARVERRRLLPRDLAREQSTLSEAARALAAAAIEGGDDRVLADRFASLTRTCVTCHSTYLHGRPEPRPVPGTK